MRFPIAFCRMLTMALALMTAMPGSAWAVYYPLQFQSWFQTFPDCGNANVNARIVDRFNWAEANTWNRGIDIRSIDGQVERSVEAFGPNPIYRRYCRGRALLSNGRHHTVYYRIERGTGLAGTGYNVEFCLPGYDRWRVYDGYCRVLSR